VIIYDDMIRTGGSLLEAAKAYKAGGATHISVITTHGLFTNNAMDRLSNSGIIEKVISLDTHPNAIHQNHPLLEVRSVAPLIIQRLLTDATGN
jgi:ribose-phosphate pyrophosphokinase